MKKIIGILILTFFVFGCTQQSSDLTIYTYDSMVSEYGLGPLVIPKFEEKCNCQVRIVSKGDAGQLLTTLILEQQNPKADIVIGIDNSLYSKAIREGILEKFVPENIYLVPENLRLDNQGYLIPYDYGFIAFMYDSEKIDIEIDSFESLLDPSLRKKIAIQHPKTSTPGLALLLWTISIYGDPGYKEYWKKLKPNILTVTDGWDESAGLFSAGEVPIYLSYASSPPYYVEFEEIDHYLAANFKEGHYVQIEGMGIIKGTKNRLLAEQFIEFSLENSFQKEIPLTQFMFPVNQSVELPESFDYALKPEIVLELDRKLVDEKSEDWILEWEKIMLSG